MSSRAPGGGRAPQGKLAALAFKTVADPFIGRMTFVRVFSGTLTGDSHVWNAGKGRDERLTQLRCSCAARPRRATPRIGLGDIGVDPEAGEASTGDTLTVRGRRGHARARIVFPDTAYAASIPPKTRNDVDKLSTALGRIVEEDPTLRVHRDDATGETIMAGLGESHIQITAERLARKYGVNVDVGLPKVAYMETVTAPARPRGATCASAGGHGQYGVCNLEIEPTERGAGFEFVDKIVGGVVPRQFIPAIEKGVREAMEHGNLAGARWWTCESRWCSASTTRSTRRKRRSRWPARSASRRRRTRPDPRSSCSWPWTSRCPAARGT